MRKIFIFGIFLSTSLMVHGMESAPRNSCDFRHNIHIKPKIYRQNFLNEHFDDDGKSLTEFGRKIKKEAVDGSVYIHLPISMKDRIKWILCWMCNELCEIGEIWL